MGEEKRCRRLGWWVLHRSSSPSIPDYSRQKANHSPFRKTSNSVLSVKPHGGMAECYFSWSSEMSASERQIVVAYVYIPIPAGGAQDTRHIAQLLCTGLPHSTRSAIPSANPVDTCRQYFHFRNLGYFTLSFVLLISRKSLPEYDAMLVRCASEEKTPISSFRGLSKQRLPHRPHILVASSVSCR